MSQAPSTSLWKQVVGFPANFWYANLMEILERLAFFGVRAIAPLYLVRQSAHTLGLSYEQKGSIYMWWAFFQCIVPMVSGGYTERYGYRKSLMVAFCLNILGYLGMAYSLPLSGFLAARGLPDAGFWVFLTASLFVAFGTAIFKPPVHGTVARTTDERTSSMGFGIFYWVVNIGGALAPMLAAELRGEWDFNRVFFAAAIVTACNFLPALLLYREPEKPAAAAGASQQGPIGVFISSIATIFKDLRLVAFLLISSCFWLMFMQLFDLLPNFIDEWVDSSDIAPVFGRVGAFLGLQWVQENGQTKPEILINIDAWSIIAFVLIISWMIRRMNKVVAMVLGMAISVIGLIGAGATQLGLLCALMIFVFAIGEMICSPTFSAYVALIASPDKKALYMGYSNIPFAIGWAVGNRVGAKLYSGLADKYALARQYLRDHLGYSAESLKELSNEDVLQRIADSLHGGLGGTVQEATRLLWELHHPWLVWVWLGAIGLAGTVGMVVFYLATRTARSSKVQVTA